MSPKVQHLRQIKNKAVSEFGRSDIAQCTQSYPKNINW